MSDHIQAIGGPALDKFMDQMAEDAALGEAWRRCEAALPEGWNNGPTLFGYDMQDGGRFYVANVIAPKPYPRARQVRVDGNEDTPAAALTALAEKLEALR